MPVTVGIGAGGISAGEYLCTQAEVITHYLRLAFWPDRLVLDYNWPIRNNISEVIAPGALILGLLIATVVAWHYAPWMGFAGAGFFVALAPTSSIVPIVDPAFEHRMYLPLAAVIALSVLAIARLSAFLVRRSQAAPRVAYSAGALLTLIAACLLGGRTVARNADYHDPVTLWRRNATDRPRNPRAHNNLCQALNDAGKNPEALAACDAALRLLPDYADALNNRANALLALGRTAEAANACAQALAVRADFADAHVTLSYARFLMGDFDGAIVHARRALDISPRSMRALNNLGNAHARKGDIPAALAAFDRALALNAHDAQTHNNIAWAHAAAGDLPQAAEHFELAVKNDPQLFEAWFNVAQIYERMQRTGDAQRAYNRALRLADELQRFAEAGLIRKRLAELARRQPRDPDRADNSP